MIKDFKLIKKVKDNIDTIILVVMLFWFVLAAYNIGGWFVSWV